MHRMAWLETADPLREQTPTYTHSKGQMMDTTKLFRVVIESRVFKSEAEIAILQQVNDITADAHLTTPHHTTPHHTTPLR